MELPFGRLDSRRAAAGRLAGIEGQRSRGDVARGQSVALWDGRDDTRLRRAADQHRIAAEQVVELGTGGAGDLFFAAARQQAPRKAGDRGVARGMSGGDLRLSPDPRREAAGDQGHDQQDDHRHHVGDAVHAKGVDRLGEEEIVGERGAPASRESGAETPQCRGREHCRKIDHVHRGGSPARRNP